jgi:hypothetical protein
MKEKNWKEPRRSAESSFSYPTNDDDEFGVKLGQASASGQAEQDLVPDPRQYLINNQRYDSEPFYLFYLCSVVCIGCRKT